MARVIVRSRSHENWSYNKCIALKFDRRLGTLAHMTNLNKNVAVLKFTIMRFRSWFVFYSLKFQSHQLGPGPAIGRKRRHNERDGVSNHQPSDCLLNRLFKTQTKENIKAPRHWPLCGEFTGERKMLPFDEVIMVIVGMLSALSESKK